jgi:V/A-type H+-transporting ATPase subunit D
MSLGRTVVSRGVLLRLREEIEFTERGKELLKLKRDHLAAETNKLLTKIASRKTFEQLLMDAYETLRAAYTSLGYWELQSQAFTIEPLKIRTITRSVIGVPVPEVILDRQPTVNSIATPAAYAAAKKLNKLIGELLSIAEAEAKIESIAQELMLTNRRVNALERVLIPKMLETMRYIERKLDDEMLEEFFRAKRVKAVIRGQSR